MAENSDCKLDSFLHECGNLKTKNVHDQVSTLCLINYNYLRWSAAFLIRSIAGHERFAYVAFKKPKPARGQ